MVKLKAPSWPVWLIGIGMSLAVIGAAGALRSNGPAGLRPDSLFRPDALPRVVVVLLFAGVVGAFVATVGLIAYVIRGSTSTERAADGYGSLGTILACFAVAVILANVFVLPYGIVQAQQHPGQPLALTPGGIVLSVVALDCSLLLVVYFRIVRPGVLTWKQLGLTTDALGERVRQGLLVGIFVIVASAVIEQALSRVGVSQTQAEMFAGIKSASFSQFVGVLLAIAVIAPACEEIFFRGYVFTAVARQRSVPWAFGVSSVLFGLAHLNLEALGPILVIGVTFCFVYWRTGSLVPTMVAHAMNNAVALTLFYFYG